MTPLLTGDRPEQDKMSGGDLDGDTCKQHSVIAISPATYTPIPAKSSDNIITQAQAALLPRRVVEPAAYPPAP